MPVHDKIQQQSIRMNGSLMLMCVCWCQRTWLLQLTGDGRSEVLRGGVVVAILRGVREQVGPLGECVMVGMWEGVCREGVVAVTCAHVGRGWWWYVRV